MLKIIGILLIVASCSAIGILQSRSYKQRVDGIRSFIDAFQIAKAEIVFKNTPVLDVFRLLEQRAAGAAKSFFGCMKADDTFSAGEILKKSNLKESENTEIDSILSVLGRYDSVNQAEVIDRGILHLEELHNSAQRELSKNGKLSSAIGVTCGIVIAVLLL